MARYHDFHAHFTGPLHHVIKILDFKPQKQAIAIWLVAAISNPAVMMLHFKAVQLENNLPVPDQLLVFPASVIASAAEEALIPPAACFYISYSNQRLRPHFLSVAKRLPHRASGQ